MELAERKSRGQGRRHRQGIESARSLAQQRRPTKQHGFGNTFEGERNRLSHNAGRLRDRVLRVSQMKTRLAHSKEHNLPLLGQCNLAHDFHLLEKGPRGNVLTRLVAIDTMGP